MSMEKSAEWKFAGESEVVGENLPQSPHNLSWDLNRAAAAGNRRTIAWDMVQPSNSLPKADRLGISYTDIIHS
jgi:hypothetical protein